MSGNHPVERPDRRVRRTRHAVVSAFGDLLRERRYEAIRVEDIVQRADVGRSTFYEHFRGKDEVLVAASERFFEVVAGALGEPETSPGLVRVVEHFWESRGFLRRLIMGAEAPLARSRLMARLTEARLETLAAAGDYAPTAPLPLAAACISEAQVGLLRAWVAGEAACSPARLADLLRETGTRLLPAFGRVA